MQTSRIPRICCSAVLACTLVLSATANAQSTRWWDRYRPANTPATPPDPHTPITQQRPDPAPSGPASLPPPSPHAQLAVIERADREAVLRPRNAHVEAGYNRVTLNDELGDESAGGAYVRASLPVTDDLYLFGSHGRVSKDWSDGEGSTLDVAIDQTEIGLGGSFAMSARTAFITELSYVRLGARVALDLPELAERFRASDSLDAAKFTLGLRGKPSRRTELWAKAGYLWLDDNLLVEDSPVVILGGQLLLTPTWGLVGEAEVYEDLRYFRLGLRASF